MNLITGDMTNLNLCFNERILLALQTIAGHALGREAILDNIDFVRKLKQIIDDYPNENIRCKAAVLVRELTTNFIGKQQKNLLMYLSHQPSIVKIIILVIIPKTLLVS